MSLDQEQTDEDLRVVFGMVDDDNSGLLDKEEVGLVIDFFSSTCLFARLKLGRIPAFARFHRHPSPSRRFG